METTASQTGKQVSIIITKVTSTTSLVLVRIRAGSMLLLRTLDQIELSRMLLAKCLSKTKGQGIISNPVINKMLEASTSNMSTPVTTLEVEVDVVEAAILKGKTTITRYTKISNSLVCKPLSNNQCPRCQCPRCQFHKC